MPDQLFRRCPACLNADPSTPCPSCGGARFVPAHGHPRSGLRITILVLLGVIVALASHIVAERRHIAEEARQVEVERAKALMMVEQARAAIQKASAAQAQTQAQIRAHVGPAR
jgi:hypothetical protein